MIENSKNLGLEYGRELESIKQQLIANKISLNDAKDKSIELAKNYSKSLEVEINESFFRKLNSSNEVKVLITEIDNILQKIFNLAANHFVYDILTGNWFKFSKFAISTTPDSDAKIEICLLPYGYIYTLAKASKTKISQIRKLFSETIKLKTVKNKPLQVSRIRFMSKYALTRGTIKSLFDGFIQNSLELIRKSDYKNDEIEGFVEVFKALIAYSKAK